jgi:hypothetical protein
VLAVRRSTIAGIVLAAVLGGAQPAIAAPQWLPGVQPFGDTPSLDASGTMAPDGTVAVARVTDSGALEVRVRPPGGDFGAPVPLAPDAGDPHLVAGRGGHIAALWRAGDTEYAAVRPPGGSFGEPHAIAEESNPSPEQLAVDGSGRVWIATPARASDSVSTVGPDGIARTFPLEAGVGFGDWSPGWVSVGVDGAGRAIVVYNRLRTVLSSADGDPCRVESEVRVAEGDADGVHDLGPLAQETLTGVMQLGGCDQGSGATVLLPSVAVRANGEALATFIVTTYSAGTEDQTQVLARLRSAGGSWPLSPSPAEPIHAEKFGPSGTPAFAGSTPVVVLYDSLRGTIELSTRAGGGSWTAPQVLAPNFGDWPVVAGSPSGALAVAFFEGGFGDPARVMGVVRAPDGTLSAPTPLSGFGDYGTAPVGIGLDDEGNGMVAWQEVHGLEARTGVAGYDGAGPRLSATFPTGGAVGQPLPFAATALDVWSGAALSWSFGDGASAGGATATHAYGAAGAFQTSVTAVDTLGNASVRSGIVAVAAPADTTRPSFRGRPTVRPKRVRRGRPVTVRFEVSEAARVQATVIARRPGVRRGRRCVAVRRPVRRGLRRCTRRVAVARKATTLDAAGAGTLVLSSRRLQPARYAIVLQATDAAGNRSAPSTLRLTVLPRAPR